MKLTESTEWQKLQVHCRETQSLHMRKLFADDQERAVRFSRETGDIFLDYSKNLVTEETLALLFELARARSVEHVRDAMFTGDKINHTEGRSVLHVALRADPSDGYMVDGENVSEKVQAVLGRMYETARLIREGAWEGYTGRPICNIINIGIGGSDLGPVMVTEALKSYSQRNLTVRFVSNIDATHFVEAVQDLDPAETLFIISSKTFTTDETLTNAHTARQWIVDALGSDDAVAQHFLAVSTNLEATEKFGIQPENVFEFWDWVGGRYSLSSAIGLSIVIAIGPDNFKRLLDGFRDMDIHFKSASLEENLPVILALIGIWNVNFLGVESELLLPYEQYLHRFPAYFQQANMESNGKSVTKNGDPVDYQTGPIVWGEPGTNGQHAFYQLLHQGTRKFAADFIGFSEPIHSLGEHHDKLIANMLAQSQAFAFGKTAEEISMQDIADDLISHKVIPGNHPSNTLLVSKLTPETLGMLIALYEHKIFVQGIIWDINSFDQWGVELGKVLAKDIYGEITNAKSATLDSSTSQLIAKYRRR